ncbi:MAG: restriction endonuclease subunit S [Syntrophales bacterium]|jgi:type I restriction enzyme S subunit|nr:restriction endonuclease subunit S [Syntrophales bacterium]
MKCNPSDWTIDRLKDVAVINALSLPADTDPDYEFNYLEISNVDYYGIVDPNAIERLCFENAPSRARRCIEKNNTVISSVRPNLQAVAFCPNGQSNFVCSTGFNVVKSDERKLIPKFVYYALISEYGRQYFEATAKGVGYPAIDDKDFSSFSMPLPPLSEQKGIAVYLDRSCTAIDAAMAAKRRQIEILDSMVISTIQHAVTQGLNPDVQMMPSGLDWLPRIPGHWKVQQIKRRCELLRGKFSHRPRNDPAFYDGDYPFVQTGDITAAEKYIRSYSQTLNDLGFSISKMFPRGTLVMSIAANVGDVAILDFEACFPDSMVGLVPNHHTHLDFLYYLMRAMKGILLRSAVLTTQLNLNYVRIGTNFAPFPLKEEQVQIAEYLDEKMGEIRTTKAILNNSIETLLAYRKSLIHECVTGQRRITEADLNQVKAYG